MTRNEAKDRLAMLNSVLDDCPAISDVLSMDPENIIFGGKPSISVRKVEDFAEVAEGDVVEIVNREYTSYHVETRGVIVYYHRSHHPRSSNRRTVAFRDVMGDEVGVDYHEDTIAMHEDDDANQ